MNQRQALQQQDELEEFEPSTGFKPEQTKQKMHLVDPAANGQQPGPQLQALIDGIGTMQRQDLDTDLLWTTHTPVETMAPEEIDELTTTMADPAEPVAEMPVVPVEEVPQVNIPQLLPLIGGVISQLDGNLQQSLPQLPVEEEVKRHGQQRPESIKEQEAWDDAEDLNHEPTFLDIGAFTADVLQEDVDAFENRIEEIALDVGIAVDNLARSSDVDLLYLTSVGFLIVVTIAVVSALFTYKQILRQPEKSGNKPTAAAMAASMFGHRNGAPAADNQPHQQPAETQNLAETAFDFLANPMSMVFGRTRAAASNNNSNNQQEIGIFGSANSNMEISRLSLHYSSANQSEEESNSLINILDRKKYHERLSATRSAEEQIQPSFFEKISTGSNTDSDLRVVRFDTNTGLAKEREMGDNHGGDGFNEIDQDDDEDSLPKFRKPVPSKHQLTQQMNASRASQQRRMMQQQQLLLFEDFSTEPQVEESRPLDRMMVGELYQHKQQQNLQAFLSASSTATCFLSEDRPQTNLNQSMASTQQDSVMLEKEAASENTAVEPTKASSSIPSKEEMLEMQRKYYFGGSDAANTEQSNNNEKAATTNDHNDQEVDDSATKLPVIQVSQSTTSGHCSGKPLDSIVELNYEASSDDELQV